MPIAVALSRPETHEAPALELASLRTQLEAVVAGGRKAGEPWATGVGALDRALGGGLPRGRITEVVGALGSGKTSLLRQVATRVLRAGGWVAWIDARRTLAPAPFAELGDRLVVVRPRDTKRSAWTADLLLRSGVFALVILDGAPPLSRVHGVRLAQLARERDAACVVLSDDARPSRVSGAVRLRVESRRSASGRTSARSASEHNSATPCMAIVVEKGAVRKPVRSIEVDHVVVVARRVCTDSEIPDRRGVARSTRRPWSAVGGTSDVGVGQPITWGGLSVGTGGAHHSAQRGARHSTHDDRVDSIYGPPRSDHTTGTTPAHRDPTRARVPRPDDEREHTIDREREHTIDRERFDRAFDKRVRDWTRYRGRRRAAESTYGRPSRREHARERVGTSSLSSAPGETLGHPAARTHG